MQSLMTFESTNDLSDIGERSNKHMRIFHNEDVSGGFSQNEFSLAACQSQGLQGRKKGAEKEEAQG